MSEDKQSVDVGEIEDAKSGLAHVDTEEKTSGTTKPVFKCESCGETQDIPEELLEKMENDEDITSEIPSHCGGTMKISVEKVS